MRFGILGEAKIAREFLLPAIIEARALVRGKMNLVVRT